MRLKTIQCLKKIDYPTEVVMLDFESRFGSRWELGFKYQSNMEYILHPEWEFMGCGFQVMTRTCNDPAYFVNGPDISHHLLGLRYKYGEDFEKATFVAKNCKFDMMVMKHHFGIVPKYVIDLDDLLRFWDARMKHGLKHVSIMEKLPAKGDTMSFSNMTYDEVAANPDKYQALVDYTNRDIENQVELFERYLPRVEYTKHEAFMARHTLDLYLYPQFEIDRPRATCIKTGMTLQLKKVARKYDPKLLGSSIKILREFNRLICGCETANHIDKGKNMQLKEGKPTKNLVVLTGEGLIPSLAKDDDGCKWLQAHPDSAVRDLIEARIGIKSWPTHISKVDGILKQSVFDGLHVPLSYYGAHTGRWTGGHAINLLNMGGKGRMTPIHTLISQVRGVLKALPGRKLSIADSCQIEARILAWLAGQHDLTEEFKAGTSPYATLATEVFKAPVWKWDDKADVEEYPGQQIKIELYYGFGKDTILGGGYGMGHVKFHSRCLQNDKLRPYFDSGEYDKVFCKGIIDTYRSKYKCIPGFWRKVEKAWRVATRHPGSLIRVLIPRTNISLKFYNEDRMTTIELPSGRKLRYRNASVTINDDLKWRWGILWGGTITENVCQAISRDLMTHWIESIETEEGFDFNVVLHCYDDITASVPKDRATVHLVKQIAIMTTSPTWANGLPLGAEGKLSERYLK